MQCKIIEQVGRGADDVGFEITLKSEDEGCEEPGDGKVDRDTRHAGQKKVQIFMLEEDRVCVGDKCFHDDYSRSALFFACYTAKYSAKANGNALHDNRKFVLHHGNTQHEHMTP